MRKLTLLVLFLPLVAVAQHILHSPDGRFAVALQGLTYEVAFCGNSIVDKGQLGVEIDNSLFESALAVPRGQNDDWCSDLELRGVEQSTVDTTWAPLYGEH